MAHDREIYCSLFQGTSLGGSSRPHWDLPVFRRWERRVSWTWTHQVRHALVRHVIVTRRFGIEEINEAAAALEAGEIAGLAILEF